MEEILNKFKGKKVLVIGDVMLDEYIEGQVTKISPEAPVPVLEVKNQYYKLGGAANVANNIKTLQGIPMLIGVIGNGYDAKQFLALLKKENISQDFMIKDPNRKTTKKTRIIAQEQQVVRVDKEEVQDISKEIESKILETAKKIIPEINSIVFQDYAKGVLTTNLCQEIIKLSKQYKIPVLVDPKWEYLKYDGSNLFKLNHVELKAMTQKEDIKGACDALFNQIIPKYIFVTKGKYGIYITEKNKEPIHVPTISKEVYDVTGAGDTVISTLSLSYGLTNDIEKLAKIANCAASIAIREQGNVAVPLNLLMREIKEHVKNGNL